MLTFTIDSAEAYCDLEIKEKSFDDIDIASNLEAGTLVLEFEDGIGGVIRTSGTGIDVAYIKNLKLVAGADTYSYSTTLADDDDDPEWSEEEDDWDEEDEEDA